MTKSFIVVKIQSCRTLYFYFLVRQAQAKSQTAYWEIRNPEGFSEIMALISWMSQQKGRGEKAKILSFFRGL